MITTHQEIANLRSLVAELEEENRYLKNRTAEIRWPLNLHIQKDDARLLTALYEVAPKTLSVDACYHAMWPFDDEPDSSSEALRSCVYRLRKILKPHGIEIRIDLGFGRSIPLSSKEKLTRLMQNEAN